MGGTTQSKLAFINPAMRKKGDKVNKTATFEDAKPEDVTKTQESGEKMEAPMTNIDLNEKTETGKDEVEGEEKQDTEAEKKEEKKEKKFTKEKILRSFRFAKKKTAKEEEVIPTEKSDKEVAEETKTNDVTDEQMGSNKDASDEPNNEIAGAKGEEPNNDIAEVKPEDQKNDVTEVKPEESEKIAEETKAKDSNDVTDASDEKMETKSEGEVTPQKNKKSAKDRLLGSFRYLKKKSSKREVTPTEERGKGEPSKEDEKQGVAGAAFDNEVSTKPATEEASKEPDVAEETESKTEVKLDDMKKAVEEQVENENSKIEPEPESIQVPESNEKNEDKKDEQLS